MNAGADRGLSNVSIFCRHEEGFDAVLTGMANWWSSRWRALVRSSPHPALRLV